ncbi:MAG TPA: methyltransferase domain-containing protein [Ilumatobacteraceae bacterium]|nr:methyltransferase domain-containing protein [Ilumatobacteraceae bacterium]
MSDGSSHTGFYDHNFGRSRDEVLAAVRAQAYGEDIGQFSWTTADEHRRFQQRLAVGPASNVLEVASGSGGPALFLVRCTGCTLVGVDIHQIGIDAANAAAAEAGLADRARFLQHDAQQPLPFPDDTFDAIISIDSMNHIAARRAMFAEWHRVLRPGGRFVFTDAVIVRGPLRRDEIMRRGPAMGVFIFTPEGEYEGLLADAGFVDLDVEDATANIVRVAEEWHDARELYRDELDDLEGVDANREFQEFLATVALLSRENRLARVAYHGMKPIR